MVVAAYDLVAGTGQKLRFCNGLRAFAYRTETALCPRFLEWTISLRYSGVERSSSHARRTSSIQPYFQEKRGTSRRPPKSAAICSACRKDPFAADRMETRGFTKGSE